MVDNEDTKINDDDDFELPPTKTATAETTIVILMRIAVVRASRFFA